MERSQSGSREKLDLSDKDGVWNNLSGEIGQAFSHPMNLRQIFPHFSVAAVEDRKKATMRRLNKRGICILIAFFLHLNEALAFPHFAQRNIFVLNECIIVLRGMIFFPHLCSLIIFQTDCQLLFFNFSTQTSFPHFV